MLSAAVPVLHGGLLPGGVRILGDDRKVRPPLALQARPAQLAGSTRWGRIVERCIQPQASNERHGLGQETPAACEESEASISGISYGHDLTFGVPAPDQEEHLPCPVG